MHTPVNGVSANRLLSGAAGCALLLLALSASGQELGPEENLDDRWIPALAIASGIAFQQQEARVESFDVTNDEPLQPADNGRDWAVTPYVGVNLELLSPVVDSLPGKPRFFVNAEFLPSFGASLDIAKKGNPKGFEIPFGDFPQGPECPFGFGCYSEAQVGGTGSKTTVEVKVPTFAVHAGISFPVELFGRQLYVKPSFGWFRYRVHVDGRVLRAIKPEEIIPDVRFVELEDGGNTNLNAIGPGLELELDVGRRGPVAPSLYFEGHAYRLLGDRKTDLSDSDSQQCEPGPGTTAFCPALLPPATYEANWRFKAKPWIYRIGMGMRFRWIGF
jgi:hypothetical protein